MTNPCDECPFRRRGKHVVRLRYSRVLELAGNMLDFDGGTFSCHKKDHGETDDDGDYQASADDVHCAGALIFALRNDNYTQMMRIAVGMHLFDPAQFCSAKQRRQVFDSIDEMLTTALPGRR